MVIDFDNENLLGKMLEIVNVQNLLFIKLIQRKNKILAQSIEVEGRFNCLSNNTNKIKQIKQENLNDDNDKLY